MAGNKNFMYGGFWSTSHGKDGESGFFLTIVQAIAAAIILSVTLGR